MGSNYNHGNLRGKTIKLKRDTTKPSFALNEVEIEKQ